MLFYLKTRMAKVENNIRYEELENKVHRVILGLDISTTCIGVAIIIDDGESAPNIVKLTHVTPKIPRGVHGIEALFLKKKVFEDMFISTLDEYNITDVIIEEPLLTSNNAVTAGTLIRFNGMISEAIYRKIGVVPHFISSYDSRMFSFPELCSIRKYNKKGEEYSLKHIKKACKDSHVVLFGSYPFDIDKKTVMMDKINDLYPEIPWVYDKKGKLKKENYDACDALVCALAYVNVNRYGIEKPLITNVNVIETADEKIVDYTMEIWGKKFDKTLTLIN
jgi:hypothetical protein